MTTTQLYQSLEHDTCIPKETTDALLELDTTASTATQASLNSMLMALHGRLGKEGGIKFEAVTGIEMTQPVLVEWVRQNMTPYFHRMFMKSISTH